MTVGDQRVCESWFARTAGGRLEAAWSEGSARYLWFRMLALKPRSAAGNLEKKEARKRGWDEGGVE